MMSIRLKLTIMASVAAILFNCAAPSLQGQSSRVLTVPSKNHPFHVVHVPSGYTIPPPEKKELGNDEVRVDLYAMRFAQGNALYLEIYNQEGCDKAVQVNGASFGQRAVLLSKKGWGYRALIPVHGEQPAGKTPLIVQYKACGGMKTISAAVDIEKTDFPVYKTPLDLGKYSNVDYQLTPDVVAFIQRCAEKKRKVFSALNPDTLGATMSHPRDFHHITSPFWSKRVYMQYRFKNKRKVMLGNKQSIHGGLDLRGKAGEPVFALASGLVAIAENMYYEGNFVVIDHGNRIFSYYMHMKECTVKEGDMVKGGDKIGLVGSTGISTAAHLHVSLVIQNVQVDPLSLLSLPVRD